MRSSARESGGPKVIKRPAEPDWYAVLGVAPDAPDGVIRETYRQLVVVFHPDRLARRLQPFGTERMKHINRAWEELNEPSKRQAYDLRRLSRTQNETARTRAAPAPDFVPYAAHLERLNVPLPAMSPTWVLRFVGPLSGALRRLALVLLASAVIAWLAGRHVDGLKLALCGTTCLALIVAVRRPRRRPGYTIPGWRRRRQSGTVRGHSPSLRQWPRSGSRTRS